MAWSARRCFSLLLLWSIAGSLATAAPVRVGVVLDLTSDAGRERLTCISVALDGFYLKHPSCTKRVELRVRDSGGDAATAAQAADDLINNARVQAIIWGPHTSTESDFLSYLGRRYGIPILSFSDISPTSCAFWLEDPATASRCHSKIGFTLENDTITFRSPKTGRQNGRKLQTGKTRMNCRGHNKTMLRIAVPQKEGFEDFVHVADPNTSYQKVTGYSVDIFEAAMRQLRPPPSYEFYVFHGSYDELVGNVSSGMYDAAVGDVSITPDRAAHTDFTMPYTQSGVFMLVLAEDEPETVEWKFVKPLSSALWFTTVSFFFYTGFVVWMIERSRNQEYQGSNLRQFSTASYFAFSTLTFSHAHTIRSPLSKIVVVVWCFVVLIVVQSYTASLSAILTAKSRRPSVTDLNQLQLRDGFVGHQEGSFLRSTLIKDYHFRENRLRSFIKKEDYADALRNGSVSAIVDELPFLTSFLSDPQNKEDFRVVNLIYRTPGFGFAFCLGSPLVHDLSTAILNITGGEEGSRIQTKWLGTESSAADNGSSEPDSTQISLQSVAGAFIITGVISTLMLLVSIGRMVHASRTSGRIADVESVNCHDGGGVGQGSLHLVSGSISHSSAASDQPLCEAVNGESHGRFENAGGQEACPMQQNGLHSGSATAESIQIEMRTV
ncbi:glutamate receptor 2.8-like [Hordeum vulgare subsp. vulgare]|nr:glutamate receptor 2.8-like [Hordeum vulgare subsp. vulgare]